MLYSFKDFEIFLLLISWNCHISQARHTIVPRSISSLMSSSYYESLKETLRPVLERGNLSSNIALQSEAVFNKSNKNSPGAKQSPANIFEQNSKNISNRYDKYEANQDNKVSVSVPLSKLDSDLYKYFKLESDSVKNHLNKSSMAPSEHEVDYDYSNQDNPDVEEPPAPIFEHRHGNTTKTENIVKSLVEKLRHGAQPKNSESLYEKYKANLSPLIKSLKIGSVEPNQHSEAFRFFTEYQKNVTHPAPTKFTSLYDEFKKRLVDFSSELDLDAGLANNKRTDSINYVGDKESVNDNKKPIVYNGGINGDHVTAEFKKVQNVVDRMEKEYALATDQKKPYEPANLQEQTDVPFSKLSSAVDLNYLENDHGIDAGQQITSGGNYIYNDYNYEDNFRPQPIFRKQEVPLRQRNRLLRGIESADKNYLTWSNTPGTDGSVYTKFFPTVYTDPINSQLSNLTAQGLLESIARRLNTTTLEVAKKIAGIQGLNLSTLKTDPQLHKILQEYIENTVIAAAQSVGVTTTTTSPNFERETLNFADFPMKSAPKSVNTKINPTQQVSDSSKPRQYEGMSDDLQQYINALSKDQAELTTLRPHTEIESKSGMSPKEVSKILAKLMKKLDDIQYEKDHNIGCLPLEDTPCKLNGSWLSKAMGLRFNIALKDYNSQYFLSNEAKSHPLNVTIQEYTPPKEHNIMDTKWPITGSALKVNGGPFFLYAQKRSENILATFVGYCRNCGGQDTVYGTWTFSFPSKSCQDTPVSFQTKNDVMRRYKLEDKRMERVREQSHKKLKSLKKPK